MISAFRIEANEKMRSRLVDTGKRDHAADAFIAALTGLVFLGAIDTWTVIEPKNDQLEDAYAEGWIFFPEKASGVGNS
ncbi:MAG: hypothetical protein Q8S00_16935 [Deltaproteobacteria bacterium]|nr:hypothetical protein [Deltaproteobacteria bacterium]